MFQQTPRNTTVKRITLPSGKELDIVTFVGPSVPAPAPAPLATCTQCGHDRVHPTDWAEVTQTSWKVELRCPDCEARREAIFGQSELDEFDVALDAGTRAIAADLDLLARANMADAVDRFTSALSAGYIVPEDF